MIVTCDYDNIPDKTGYRLSGWRTRVVDGVAQRTNVTTKVDGRNVPVWPAQSDGVWAPTWAVVTE
jgi:hypothetical protein